MKSGSICHRDERYLDCVDHSVEAVSGHFDFAEASGSDLLDLDELLVVARNVNLGHSKSLGRKHSVLDLLHGLDGLVTGVVAVVSQVVPEIKK